MPTQTVALFTGPVEVDRNGRATVSFDVPDFNGELRLMAVAWSGRAVGQAAQPLTVRDDVPAELILPRFLAPGDQSTATLTIDNIDGAPGAYAVAMDAEAPVSMSATDTIELAAGQRVDRRYGLSSDDAGVGSVGLSVDGPDDFAVAQLSDRGAPGPGCRLPASGADASCRAIAGACRAMSWRATCRARQM